MIAIWKGMRAALARRGWSLPVVFCYGALVLGFCAAFVQFHLPGQGFTSLLTFGSATQAPRLERVRALNPYVERDSHGYDAQYYVQIAMDPTLRDPELRGAVDNLPYRARRILLPAVAHVVGLGRPSAILEAFACLNAVCWIVLAALLLHWFPPDGWGNLLRWAGVLFSFGLCLSVRNALTDGPALLLVALGLFWLERGRPWLATAMLAAGGLAKETSLLAAGALAPRDITKGREIVRAVVRGGLVALPLALWLLYVGIAVGAMVDTGSGNFDLPGTAAWRKLQEVWRDLPDIAWAGPGALWSLLVLLALAVQGGFLLLRPRWSEAWWRVGVGYAALLAVVGDAVWEGYPGAVSRVLLPLQLAFNVLVPRGRWWWPVLIAGNLTMLSAPSALRGPALYRGYILEAPAEVFTSPAGQIARVEFSRAWHTPEGGRFSPWVWAQGSGTVSIWNPQPHALALHLRAELETLGTRSVELRLNGRAIWRSDGAKGTKVPIDLRDLPLEPGENRLEFSTDAPPERRPPDPRPLAYCLRELRLSLTAPPRAP